MTAKDQRAAYESLIGQAESPPEPSAEPRATAAYRPNG
jgi:hypothetical protein